MKKSNIYSPGDQRKINPNWFTGKVHMKDISSKIKSKGHGIYHVYFQNGSKTKLHYHDGNQVLIATSGHGILEIFKKIGTNRQNFKIKKIKKINLNQGDTVFIPAKTLHIHGSINKKKTFSHVAINIQSPKSSGYKTIWFESDFKTSVTKIVD